MAERCDIGYVVNDDVEWYCKRERGHEGACMGPLNYQEIEEATGLHVPEEERLTNPTTGGQKGIKLARYDLLPPGPLRDVATHYGVGAKKYEDRNWERGYSWSLSFGAMQRHAWAFWGGEDIDPETGSPHLAAVVFHALALMEYSRTHKELDDRPCD